MRNSKIVFLLFLTLSLAAAQLVFLWWLPYTTSALSYISVENGKLEANPSPNFRLGSLDWDVERYRKSAELEVFRRYFQEHCATLEGISAANCLSNNFLQAIPFGEPENEFFSPNYSPAQAFEKHLKGMPGHCVTFSGFTSVALLSVGIPARVVQIIPKDKGGHNIIEVWDKQEGWVLFDPLNGSLFSDGKKYLSAFEIIKSDEKTLRRVRTGNKNDGYLKDYYNGEAPFDGAIVYPEPYLYTRVGKSVAPVGFRASLVTSGEKLFYLGTAQICLRVGILICGLLFLLNVGYLLFADLNSFERRGYVERFGIFFADKKSLKFKLVYPILRSKFVGSKTVFSEIIVNL